MDAFYNNIFYQNGALKIFAEKLKQEYFKKKILCIFSSGAKDKHYSEILNILNKSSCVYSTIVLDRTPILKQTQINEIFALKARSYDLVVGVGGGQCSDAVKILAKRYNCPSIMIACNFGNMSYFNDFSLIEDKNKIKFENVNSHSYIFIEEKFVKSINNNKINPTIMFCCSLSMLIQDIQFYYCIFNQSKYIEILQLKSIILKMKNELSNITNDDEKKLRLMDYIIDLSFVMKDCQTELVNTYKLASILNMLIKKREYNLSFGELCYISSCTLQEFYHNFYSIKNIQIFETYLPTNVQNLCDKFGVELSCIQNQEIKPYYYKNKLFFQKINATKNKLEQTAFEMKKELLSSFYVDFNKKISAQDLYDCVKLMTLMYDTGMVLGLIKNAGLLNA